ncbi:hypothetical protein [Humibacter sp.]|uniref:hypothetical protein n=1 Tax=Humibacter sp. TaxID=1940291 RepID=UPI003F7DD435
MSRAPEFPKLPSLGGWNYRVVQSEKGGELAFDVCEVYYTTDGTPVLWSDAVAPHGETLEGLRADLAHFAQALERPVVAEAELKRLAGEAER